MGLLGFWGEWHTYPHEEWMPPVGFQAELLEAFVTALPNTQLEVRTTNVAWAKKRLGYHDDSFCYSTDGDVAWYFWPKCRSDGVVEERFWEHSAVGGELRPELQTKVWHTTTRLTRKSSCV